jgi:rhodanese-related sulfurtransferase
MMGWTEDDDVLATARFGPDVQGDFRLEAAAAAAAAGGDEFEVVRAAAEEYLGSGKAPVISADALWENLNDGDESNDPFIVSVRSPEHYELGHVPGAINIPWKTIAEPESLATLPTDRPIVAYCYTGHTGQVATTALSLLGYDVTNLKFGMMGWTEDDEVLATARYGPETAIRDYRIETEPNEATESYDYPELSTGGADDFEIVRLAIDDWVKNAAAPIIPADNLWENINDGDESNDPFILSVRSPEHYELGHIPGAVNIPWKALADPENLAMLPSDQNITTYCYTGHTGQVAATVLGVLGYDVSNLKYGMMGWTEDDDVLATARFGPDVQRDYRIEGAAAAAGGAAESTSPEPEQLPASGGALVPTWLALLASGLMSLGAGWGLRRRLAN